MSRQQPKFKQVDITRTLKAIRSAGVDVAKIEVDAGTGKITVFTGTTAEVSPANAFDEWKGRHARPS